MSRDDADALWGLALSSVGLGILLGPAISGPLAELFGPHAPFLLIAALAAADAVARIALIKPMTAAPDSDIRFRQLLAGPRVSLLISMTMLGAGMLALPEPVVPLHLHPLGVSTSGLGVVFAAAGLVGSLVAPLAGLLVDRLGTHKMAATGSAIAAIGLVLVGRESLLLSISGLIVLVTASQFVLAPTLVLIGELAEYTQPAVYGIAYALYNLAYTGGLAIAPIAAGAATHAIGFPATTLFAFAVALLITTALLIRRGSGVKQQLTELERAE